MVREPATIRDAVPDSKENKQKCYCPKCPSYPHDYNGDLLFCGKNASNCDINAQGCLCYNCSIYFEYGLKGLYYCANVPTGESGTLMRKMKSGEDRSFYKKVVDIQDQSITGQSTVVAMGSQKTLPFSLDDLYFLPAQVRKIPLNVEEPVNTSAAIGPQAKKPLAVNSPIIVSGMSYGAVSKNVKLVIAKTAAKLKFAFNSGEGGIIDEERDIGRNYRIVQYSTGRFGIDETVLASAAAVEIRFGQGAYPGKGSYLPAKKMSPEVARARGLSHGEAAYSPAHHPDLTTVDAIKDKVSWLREVTRGAPIGAKIGCGDVTADVADLADAGMDFIAVDGFGGGTGATNLYVRENVGIPVCAALPQAYEALQEMGLKDRISLIAGGGLRSSADFAKCLALGADAVYIATAALIAINCQQYRICYSGLCPTGVTTTNLPLMQQLNIDEGITRLSNFITLSTNEVANLTRIVGKRDINQLCRDDLISASRDLSMIADVKWIDGKRRAENVT